MRDLGGEPPSEARTKFPLKTPASVLRLAARVENVGAAAYLGQAANIKSKEVLAAALSIHASRRATPRRSTPLGKSSTPEGSFALPMTMNEDRRAARMPLRAEAKALARSFGRHEQDHAETLAATLSKLGGEPRAKEVSSAVEPFVKR